MSKVIKPLLIIPAAALLAYAVKKGKKSSSVVFNVAQAVSDAATPERTFAGFRQSELNEIALNTNRGLGAEIVGDALEFVFKSRSGKQTATARIVLDAAGELVFAFLPYSGAANSPLSFIENLRNARNNKVN